MCGNIHCISVPKPKVYESLGKDGGVFLRMHIFCLFVVVVSILNFRSISDYSEIKQNHV